MTDSMVDRVAVAILAANDVGPTNYWTLARAAIAAMREPTKAMEDVELYDNWSWDDISPRRAWQTMIDAALKPDPAPGAAASTPACKPADRT